MPSSLSVLAVVALRQGKSGPRYVVRLTMPRAVLWLSYRVEDCPTEDEAVARAVRHLAEKNPRGAAERGSNDQQLQQSVGLRFHSESPLRVAWWGRLGEQGQA